MRLRISKGNTKLGHIPNVSHTPIRGCGVNARHCARQCYAVKFMRLYTGVREAWAHNYAVLRDAMQYDAWDDVVSGVVEYLWEHPAERFRWHVSGDFLSQAHVQAANDVALCTPDTMHLAYTKRDDLQYEGLAPNFRVRFSMWPGFTPRANVMTLPMFWASPDERCPEDAVKCPGSCTDCALCWDDTPHVHNPIHR